jgi:hypothetical protein
MRGICSNFTPNKKSIAFQFLFSELGMQIWSVTGD